MFKNFRGPITFIALFLFFIVGYLIGGNHKVSAEDSKDYRNLDLFARVINIVKENYVEEPDYKDLIYGAINGMLDSLDPHSAFMDPDFYREMQIETKGSFGGLGIEITIKDSILTIVAPIEDTPAYKAGIKPGDQIVYIDGKSTKGITLLEAVKKLRGKPGSKVTISVMREGVNELKEFTITRAEIKLKSVKYKMLEPGYGYLRITSFQQRTIDDFRKALTEMEKESLEGLILDLRNNPGGLLDAAVDIADEFINSGLIVKTDGRKENQRMKFTAKTSLRSHDYPMIVLINEGSASASEIVAGALQDHKKAIIMGKKSFGKGTVQSIIQLGDGSALKLTTAKYYTPSGRSIQAMGIEPDIEVEQGYTVTSKNSRPRFSEKDLDGHFEPEADDPNKDESESEAEPLPEEESNQEEEITDTQLDRALDLLKGWKIFKHNNELVLNKK